MLECETRFIANLKTIMMSGLDMWLIWDYFAIAEFQEIQKFSKISKIFKNFKNFKNFPKNRIPDQNR